MLILFHAYKIVFMVWIWNMWPRFWILSATWVTKLTCINALQESHTFKMILEIEWLDSRSLGTTSSIWPRGQHLSFKISCVSIATMAKTGRPENRDVRKYFKHDEETKVSVCLVSVELPRKETAVSKSRESIQQIWEVISRRSTHKSSKR